MSRYYDRGSNLPKEKVPNVLWDVDILNCCVTAVRLEILSVFDVGAHTCLCFSPRKSWRHLDILETLDKLSLKSGYPRVVDLDHDERLFPAIQEWACVHGVDLRTDVTLQNRIAERRAFHALAAINEYYNLDRGWPHELASRLMDTMNKEQPRGRR